MPIFEMLLNVSLFGRFFQRFAGGSCRSKDPAGDMSFSASWEALPTSCSSCSPHSLYLRSSNVLPSESWACQCGAGHG